MRSAYLPATLSLPRPGFTGYSAVRMRKHRLFDRVEDLREKSVGSDHLFYSEIGSFCHGNSPYSLPRFVFLGPGADDSPVRIAIFAAIHGDEPETADAALEFLHRLMKEPQRAKGYQLFVYPICNPTGLEDGTRHSRNGLDLNREFWQASKQPEVYYLEQELGVLGFQGVISLHADDTANGVYAFVRGATLTEALARPAITAAEAYLPRATGELIDNFPAQDALICNHCYDGILTHPAELRPVPFEIIFETPHLAPSHLQVDATVAALNCILEEYRPFLAIGQGL